MGGEQLLGALGDPAHGLVGVVGEEDLRGVLARDRAGGGHALAR